MIFSFNSHIHVSLCLVSFTLLPQGDHSQFCYLRSNDEQTCFRIELSQCFSQMGAINIRNKMAARSLSAIRLQCFGNHKRTQVRSTDAYVNDISDGFPSPTCPFTRAYFVAEFLHVGQGCVNIWHDLTIVFTEISSPSWQRHTFKQKL